MSDINSPKTISKVKTTDLETPGITPLKRNGNFSGILISIGENDDPTAERLLRRLQQNTRAGIDECTTEALE